MSVVTEPAREGASPPPGKKKQNWLQQHKALAGIAGAGGLILLLGHRGASSGSSSAAGATNPNDVAAGAAAEQAAIDGAVQAQTGTVAGYGNTGGGSDGSGAGIAATGTNSIDPNAVSSVDPNAAGGSQGSAGLTINVNTTAPKTAATPHKSKPKPTAKPKSTPHKTTSVGHGSKTPTPKKPAPKKPKVTRPPTHKPKHSVMMHGRTFDGALAGRTGVPTVSRDGITHTPVTVVYGSHTERHMSHNNGMGWTDNIPGMNPPSRGVPEIREGTAA